MNTPGGSLADEPEGHLHEVSEKPPFNDVYMQYYKLVRHHFRIKGCSIEDANDLTQDTFLRAYANYATFQNKGTLKAWIMTIAANVWINNRRSHFAAKNQGVIIPLNDETSSPAMEKTAPGGPESRVLGKELSSKLFQEIKKLPPKMLEIYVLRHGHELSYKEIASITKSNINTVKSQLSQAKEKVKDKLSSYFRKQDS